MPGTEPSNGEILEKLGVLQGQVATLIILVGQKREDINAMFARLGAVEKSSSTREELTRVEIRLGMVEKEVAKWAGICIAISVVLPIALPQLQRALGVIERDALHGVEQRR